MTVAVIGGGINGLGAACVLANAGVHVVVYEKEDSLGGHAKTVNFDGVDLDLGFMLFNPVTSPKVIDFFMSLGFDMETLDMSISVSSQNGQGLEWGTRNGLSSLFAQKLNVLNPQLWKMIREMIKFKTDVLRYVEVHENNPDVDRNETLGEFVKSHGYSELFQKAYLVPLCGAFWCFPSAEILSFSAFSVLSFFRNNHLFQLFSSPQWLTIKQRSGNFVQKVSEVLETKGCVIRTNSEVHSVSTTEEGCIVLCGDGYKENYTGCIIAVHANDALRLLGDQATYDELRVLGAFQYVHSDIFLHRDKKFMPQNPAAWSAWNFIGSTDQNPCLTYWLNQLQNIGETSLPFLVTLNPYQTPENTLLKCSTGHLVPSVAASRALKELDCIQGYGHQEEALKAGITAATGVLGKPCDLLSNPKHIVPSSLLETGARHFVTKFLRVYLSTGCLSLLEEGGTMFTFGRRSIGSSLKCILRIHSPQFYWKVMTRADLGIADAYIHGDFSFDDKDEGLLNLFLVLIANRDFNSSTKNLKNRSWWIPFFFNAGVLSANYFNHMLRKNTLTQARRNISRHYDLSNELFSLFLDETMTYSCAVFEDEDEDLKIAQLRKISLLIEKARIDKKHEVLEIGCGWGSLAIEVVRQTGCKYTGITLSKEQFEFAEERVKEAGLQDHIRFILCDYRLLPDTIKYDRIMSCGMIEHVGHEYMEEYFASCESLLAEDGLLVLQFIWIPDERYDTYRRSTDFIKEYIFPGGCLPSLSRVTSAMATASNLCVEHLENIGIHYYYTLRKWRKNFLSKRSEILALGFDDKFIRAWEYYFDYCAAGFKSRTLGDYQVVFSRPGNNATFSNPFKSWPSA